jgi:hypothetical protein
VEMMFLFICISWQCPGSVLQGKKRTKGIKNLEIILYPYLIMVLS